MLAVQFAQTLWQEFDVAEEATIADTPNDSEASLSDGDLSRMFTDAAGLAPGPAADVADETPVVPDEAPVVSDQAPVVDPVVDPVPAASEPAEPVAVEPPTIQSSELLAAAKDLGIATEGMKSADELAAASMRKLHESMPLLNYAQQLLPYADEIREFFASRNGQSAQQVQPQAQDQQEEWTPDSHFSSLWGGPQWDSQFTEAINSGMVQRDPSTGLWQSSPGYEVITGAMLEPLNAAHRHATNFWTDLSRSNPYQKFYQAMEEPLRRTIRNDIEEMLRQREQEAATTNDIASFERQHEATLYRTNPITGRREPTEQGQLLLGSIERINRAQTPQEKLAIAVELAGIGKQAAQQQAQPVPAAQPAPAVPAQQAAPAQPVAAAPTDQRSQQSFLDGALRVASHSPSSNGSGDAMGTAPVQMEALELGNFFVNQFKSRT
jgi:hypothetical protein